MQQYSISKQEYQIGKMQEQIKQASHLGDKKKQIAYLKGVVMMLRRHQEMWEIEKNDSKLLPQTTIDEPKMSQAVMQGMCTDYKKITQSKEQQLIVLKQEKFVVQEQLDDVQYELHEHRKMLEFLSNRCQEREEQKCKIFNEINRLQSKKQNKPQPQLQRHSQSSQSSASTPRNNLSGYLGRLNVFSSRRTQNSLKTNDDDSVTTSRSMAQDEKVV